MHAGLGLLLTGTHALFSRVIDHRSFQFVHFISLAIILINVTLVTSVGNPHEERFENILPGVSRWNGKPFYDFRLVWWPALVAALGSVAQEGLTLLQCARSQDPDGTAAERTRQENRNIRLFNCMVNYIHHKSWVYKFVTTQFPNDGRGLFNYL